MIADENIHRRSCCMLSLWHGCKVGPNYKRPRSGCPRTVPRHRARSAATAGQRTLRGNEVAELSIRTKLCRRSSRKPSPTTTTFASPPPAFCRRRPHLGITRANQFPTVGWRRQYPE